VGIDAAPLVAVQQPIIRQTVWSPNWQELDRRW